MSESLRSYLSAVRRFTDSGVNQENLLNYDPTPEDLIDYAPEEFEHEVERYWVNRPYSFVSIIFDEKEEYVHYRAVEPGLTDFENELLDFMIEDLRDKLIHLDWEWDTGSDSDDFRSQSSHERTKQIYQEVMIELLSEYGLQIQPAMFYRVYYYIWRTFIGYGRLDPIIRDSNVEDISCDGYDIPIFLYHEEYDNIRTNVSYDESELDSFIISLAQEAGKNISMEKPQVSGTLDDGSRIELTYGNEVTQRGSTYTIRKFAEDPFTPIDLINTGTFSLEQMAYLWLVIENKKSLIFAGGTASGKTTSMNAVSMFIPPDTKVISIEDTPEINLYQDNWIPSVTREGPGIETELDMYSLLRSGLRQRPEYIIVGEVRGEEALTLFQAMNTGHTTYSTLHAESIHTAIRRLENPPIDVPRAMFEGLDIISVQILTQVEGERVRRTNAMVEIEGIDDRTSDINFVEIFDWEAATDSITQTANSQLLEEISDERGEPMKKIQQELRNRQRVLEYLMEKNIRYYEDFTSIIHQYYRNPQTILDRIENESAM